MKNFVIILVSTFQFFSVSAQVIKNTSVNNDPNAGQVNIKFEIDGKPKERYKINLYYSLDGYSTPIKLKKTKLTARGQGLYGAKDLSSEYESGQQHELIWDYNSFRGYNQSVKFKIGYELAFSPLDLSKTQTINAKRNKDLKIRWEGGMDDEDITITLYKNDEFIKDKLIDNYSKEAFINLGDRKGNGYHIMLSESAENTDRTEYFKIKPSIPFIIKIIPFVAGAAFAAYVYLTYEPPLDPLPAPPEPN